MKCIDCETTFQSRVACIDGVEAYRPERCPECAAEIRAQERRQEAQERLIKACEEQQQVWIKMCGCPVELLKCSFETFDAKAQPKAFRVMSGFDFSRSVILSSADYGLGKTHLAAAVVNRILREEPPARLVQSYYVQTLQCPVYFTTEPRMLDRIRATFDKSGETDEQVYRQLERVRLLIVDDVGKVKPKDMAFTQSVYFRVMDSRCTTRKPVILTTNLDWVELEQHIGGASADRLRGMCGKENMVVMAGKSYRR